MSQTSADQTGATPADPTPGTVQTRMSIVETHDLLGAAQRLAEASAGGDRDAGKRFLTAARSHGIDLSNFWTSSDPGTGRVREAVLGVRGSGRTAMFFTSPPRDRAAEAEIGQLIDLACVEFEHRASAEHPGVRLAQALLNPGERGSARAFQQGGFHELARLAYLGRPVPTPAEFENFTPWQLPDSVRATSLAEHQASAEETDSRLLVALSRSYEQTLDCPELCGLRTPQDVLDSHRSVRKYDPRWWWLIEEDGVPEGVMLFTANPEQGDVELVYLGISPKLRGRGIARVLMRSGMRELAFGLGGRKGRARGQLSCAVDLANEPARRLYRGLGFQMTAERVAMVRSLCV